MADPASLTCTENIALFHLLHAGRGKDGTLSKDSVPTRPSVGPVEALPIYLEDYALSFERERSLAGALAYISNIKDDPNRIPAICIEEDHRPRGKSLLRILLAVNSSECKDGDDLLKAISTSFEGIFAVLSRVVDDDDQVGLEHEICHLIVSMCSHRILRRLHFKRCKNKTPKQPAREKFQNVIRALAPHGAKKLPKLARVSDEERALFLERAKEIIRLINAWTNHPRPQQLEDLVHGFFRLRKVDCQAVVNAIPDVEMETSAKNSLMNMILKVARYAEAARFLFRTAKKFRIARQMQVMLVTLPENAFRRTPVDSNYKLSLSSVLSRVSGVRRTELSGQGYQADTVCGLLDTTPNEADDDLTAQASRTLTTGKVHAEVQLVFYCEMLKKSRGLNKNLLPPRTVCSSKKACFLCNLLVSMHDKMRMPWCHGKLYPGWRLPEFSGLDLQLRFNHVLEDRIRESIALLLERRRRSSYPGPSESTLITLPSLVSEPESVPLSEHGEKIILNGTQAQGINGARENVNAIVIGDNVGPQSSSGSVSSTVDLRTVTGEASREANQCIKSDSESQNAPPSLCSTEKLAKGGCQQQERVVQGKSPYEASGQKAKATHSPFSVEDHVDCTKNNYPVSQGQNRPDIAHDPTKSPDTGDQNFQSPTTYEESVNSLEEYYHLRHGQKLSQVMSPKHTITFFTRSLVVQVEYSTGSSLKAAAEKQPHKLPFSIDRLGSDEIARLKEHGTIPIENAEAMTGEIPVVLPSIDNLYIAASGVVFKITFH